MQTHQMNVKVKICFSYTLRILLLFFDLLDIAKSMIIFDIKPWDHETDINAMEQAVRTIEVDGLLCRRCKQR